MIKCKSGSLKNEATLQTDDTRDDCDSRVCDWPGCGCTDTREIKINSVPFGATTLPQFSYFLCADHAAKAIAYYASEDEASGLEKMMFNEYCQIKRRTNSEPGH